MNARSQRLCVWCGVAAVALFGLGFAAVAGFVPPPSPGTDADHIRQLYIDDSTRIRAGLIIAMAGPALLLPWTAVITLQMRRIEGRWSPMALTQLAAGTLVSVLLTFPLVAMCVAAYRPEQHSAEFVQGFNDLGWLWLFGLPAVPMVQGLAIAVAVLGDRREAPVFPRWVGYFNLWYVLLVAPGALVFAFHSGPFAWNGLFVFWLGLAMVGSWFAVTAYTVLGAVGSHEREYADQRPELELV